MKEYFVPVVSIIAITIILIVAMFLGKNGIILAGGLMAISGLGGYEIKSIIDRKKGSV